MIVNLLIFFYLVGGLAFTLFADFNNTTWCDVYYAWQGWSHGGVLAWAALYFEGTRETAKKVKWVLLYSILLEVWNLIKIFTGVDINNSWAVDSAFLLLIALIMYLTFYNEGKHSKSLGKTS